MMFVHARVSLVVGVSYNWFLLGYETKHETALILDRLAKDEFREIDPRMPHG